MTYFWSASVISDGFGNVERGIPNMRNFFCDWDLLRI
jgi:hypothetical protein